MGKVVVSDLSALTMDYFWHHVQVGAMTRNSHAFLRRAEDNIYTQMLGVAICGFSQTFSRAKDLHEE